MSQFPTDPHLVEYQPIRVDDFRPPIAIVGCGSITVEHLRAYRDAGLAVVTLCDIDRSRAESRRSEFFPQAKVVDDPREVFRDDNVMIVDLATHPAERGPLIAAAIEAGKHILSQKPFVLDLDEGNRLVEAAARNNVQLAVNQNGRWAPHFSYLRQAVAQGLIGRTFAVQMGVHWDHTWVRGTPFEKIKHLILYDFAIHWFDMVRCLLPDQNATRVYASSARAPGQSIMPALLAQVLIEFESAQASMAFDAMVGVGPWDHTYVTGTTGSLRSEGPNYREQTVTVMRPEGTYQPALTGTWFPDGFRGTMVELIQSIQQRRPTTISAEDNLKSLELCFAAIASVEQGRPVQSGSIRRLPE